MITPLCQRNPQWSHVRMGESAATLGNYGCTTTSLCMVLQKIRGTPASPGDAAKFWAYNLRGEILWAKTKFKGMKFVWRGYNADIKKLKEYANDPKKGVIMEVNHRAHWLYIEKVEKGIVSGVDPINGKKFTGLPKKYTFTGYALFEGSGAPQPLKK